MKKWNKIWQKSFTIPGYRICLHVLFWVLYFVSFASFTYKILGLIGWKGNELAISFEIGMILNIVIILLSYYLTISTTYRFLVVRQQYLLFFVFIVINVFVFCNLVLGGDALKSYILSLLGIDKIPDAVMLSSNKNLGYWGTMTSFMTLTQLTISYFALLCVPVASKFFRDQMRMLKRQSDLQKKNIQLEMDFLKAQIHPHFLFNTLNNIYSLISHDENKKSAEMISGLSSLLRYALYDGKTEFILLEKEIGMLKDFIGLEEVRTDDLHLDLKMPDHIPAAKFPPFLLLPLVENAFKHGANSQLSHPCVKIEIVISDHQLCLQVKNSFDHEYRKKNSGGLGLLNLKKRLDYYYHDNYSLETDERDNIFIATLKLPL